MSIFIRLADYAEYTKFHGHPLPSATLALVVLGLFLLLKKEWSIHSSTKFPIVGIESPGYFGLVKAREKFVSDAFHIVKKVITRLANIQFAQLLVLVYIQLSKVLTLYDLNSTKEETSSLQPTAMTRLFLHTTKLRSSPVHQTILLAFNILFPR